MLAEVGCLQVRQARPRGYQVRVLTGVKQTPLTEVGGRRVANCIRAAVQKSGPRRGLSVKWFGGGDADSATGALTDVAVTEAETQAALQLQRVPNPSASQSP